MSKELVVSTTSHETRVAILEDDKLTEIYVEQDNQHAVAGSIYKGRVSRVLPGMQSAFVQIGLERDAFLYVSDFFEETEELEADAGASSESSESESRGSRRRGGRRDRRGGRRRGRRRGREDGDTDDERNARPSEDNSSEERSDEPEAIETRERDDRDEGRRDRDSRRGRGRRRGRVRSGRDRDRDREREASSEEPSSGRRREARSEDDRPRRRETRTEDERPARRERGSGLSVLPGETLAKYGSPSEAEQESEADDASTEVGKLAEESVETVQEAPEPTASNADIDSEEHQGQAEPEVEASVVDDEPIEDEDSPVAEDAEAAAEEAHAAAIAAEEAGSASEPANDEPEEEEEEKGGLSWWRGPFRRYRRPRSRLREAVQRQDDQSDRRGNEEPPQTEDPDPTPVEAPDELTAVAAEVVDEAQARLESVAEPEDAVPDEHPTPGMPVPVSDEDAETEEEPVEASVRAPRGDGEYVRRGRRGRRRGGRGRRSSGSAEAADEPRDDEQRDDAPRSERDGDSRSRESAAPSRPREGRGSGRRGDRQRDNQRNGKASISDLLSPGQEILVQVAKEPLGKKGARITSHIALPGRFLVYMPTVDHIGVSRKIGTEPERQRLRRTVQDHRDAEEMSGGFILRTACEGALEDEIRADMSFLHNLWKDIKRKSESRRAPALVHHDLDVVERVLRDFVGSDFKTIWVDNEDQYEHIVHFVERFQPSMLRHVKLYVREEPIFDAFSITQELEKALRPKVWLKSGGYIVINQTEALVAIDVNTGKFVGRSDLEDTIVRTNLEAVREIVRQIRLRDLGGIIVLDFIDMEDRKNRSRVHQALQQELAKDHAPSKALQFNDFGLVTVTRKRVKQSLERALCEPCPYCTGAGYVKSVKTVIFEIISECQKVYDDFRDQRDVSLRVSPDVAKVLKEKSNSYLIEIEEALDKNVLIRSDASLHRENFDLN